MKKYTLIFMLSVFSTTTTVWADDTTQPIGTSYFSSKPAQAPPEKASQNSTHNIGTSYFSETKSKASHATKEKTITIMGPAVEAHQNFTIFYVFMNQLFPNHIFYELRADAIKNYVTQNTPAPPTGPEVITRSSLHPPMGFGGVGILGYNIHTTQNTSLMPFVRVQKLSNLFAAYSDSFGNKITSDNYTAYLGANFSMKVTEQFAIYLKYYAGYQRNILSGSGLFASKNQPIVNVPLSIMEVAIPYKINQSWSLTPYFQYITGWIQPNQIGREKPYHIDQLTNTNTTFALRINYTL